jgi:hypothetical protein
MNRKRRYALAILGATAAVGELLIALHVSEARCGDSCEVPLGKPLQPGIQWWQDENAWQWNGQAWLAAANLVVVLAACGLYLRGRERAARIATAIGVSLFALWAAAVQPVIL